MSIASFDIPHREDYSPSIEEITTANLDVHQTFTEPFRCRERDFGIQLIVRNTAGSLRLISTFILGKPVRVMATRKT